MIDFKKELTKNELHALVVLIKSCLYNMGGERPADLESDPYTWVNIYDLVDAGWSKPEASGTFSSLDSKGILSIDTEGDSINECWNDLDLIWEEVKHISGPFKTER